MRDSDSVTAARRSVIVWVMASTLGAAILALPDDDARLFSFSETHGPSAVDVAGMVVLLAGWLPVAWVMWSRRATIDGFSRRWAGILAVAGAGMLVVTIGLDLGASWLVAVAVLVAAQVVALRSVALSGRTRPPASAGSRP